MANWITHCTITDMVFSHWKELDERGFCVGSIAPDCNLENDDWTVFIPPREVTHFMTGGSKLSADFAGFYDRYIRGKTFQSEEHRSFLLGYCAHLITDAAYQAFIRNEERVPNCYARLRAAPELLRQIEGQPETFDTLKKVFGKRRIFRDIVILEHEYVLSHPEGCYERVLRKTEQFPDYLDFFPSGAVPRKIRVMAYPVEPLPEQDTPHYFFAREEYEAFLNETCEEIVAFLRRYG